MTVKELMQMITFWNKNGDCESYNVDVVSAKTIEVYTSLFNREVIRMFGDKKVVSGSVMVRAEGNRMYIDLEVEA